MRRTIFTTGSALTGKRSLRSTVAATAFLATIGLAPAQLSAQPSCFGLASTIVIDDAAVAASTEELYGRPYFAGTDEIDVIVVTTETGVSINSFDGNDRICGGDGSDRIASGDGSDFIDGGAGNDRLAGGEGNDVLDGGLHNDVLYGGPGLNDLDTSEGRDYLFGGDDIDRITITGAARPTRVAAGAGNDIIEASTSTAVLYGEEGNDTFRLSVYFQGSVQAGDGNDLVESTAFKPGLISTGAGNDTVTSTRVVYDVYLGDGDDTTDIVPSNDPAARTAILGGAGSNTVRVNGDSTGLVVRLGTTSDRSILVVNRFQGDTINPSIGLSPGDDYVIVGGIIGDISVNAGAGNDEVNLWKREPESAISLYGGAGHDLLEISGAQNNVTIEGGDGNDDLRLHGYDIENARLRGGNGHDLIEVTGAVHNSVVHGDAGDDGIYIGAGIGAGTSDTVITGGLGHDHIQTDRLGDGIRIFAGGGHDFVVVYLSGDDIILRGDAGYDYVGLLSSTSDAILLGGVGNDLLEFAGDGGGVLLDGGHGTDEGNNYSNNPVIFRNIETTTGVQ